MNSLRIGSAAMVITTTFIALSYLPVALAEPPKMLLQGKTSGASGEPGRTRSLYAMMRLPDGSFAFYDRNRPQDGPLTLPSRDGNLHTLLPSLPARIAENQPIIDSRILANQQVILTPNDDVIGVLVKREDLTKEAAVKVGLPRYLNVWMQRASLPGVSKSKMIWRGYNGSQMEYQQLPSGRLLVPFGSFQPHATPVPPTGRHKTVIQYSDDQGASWTESASKLISPCYAGFNGNNEGACEPAIEQLTDGRIWMLMRTQAGFLYESFSSDDGTSWRHAVASRFNTSTGPPNIMRHKNGWLVVCWNNCEMPPREKGQGVYGGRDALHIAVSDDEGKTWRGFREVYLDHRRNDNPARSGDRGTAYPLGAWTSDGKIVMLAGQGEGGRNPILIDPNWIIEIEANTDFSDGLSQWSVYKHHGPAKRWWRARAVGCELVANPTDPTARSLHIRKADELPADGATWNFPNGWVGSLTARVMIRKGSPGGMICLNDRMFDPANDYGEQLAVFSTDLSAGDGRNLLRRAADSIVPSPLSAQRNNRGEGRVRGGKFLSAAVLTVEEWHEVTLKWDLAVPECQVLIDGIMAGVLPIKNETLNGISYVRFRSAAKTVDSAGFLVDSVSVSISDPYAPSCSPSDQIEQERRYVTRVVPTWTARN